MPPAVLVAIVLFVLFVGAGLRIIKEYERAVIFRFGRIVGARGPGLFFIIPVVEQYERVNLRMVIVRIPVQTVVASDRNANELVTIDVEASVRFRVVDPARATVDVESYRDAVVHASSTAVRSVTAGREPHDILTLPREVNSAATGIAKQDSAQWGIEVEGIEIERTVVRGVRDDDQPSAPTLGADPRLP